MRGQLVLLVLCLSAAPITTTWFEPVLDLIEKGNIARNVMALEGKSVKLRCSFTADVQDSLSHYYSYSVQWHDMVHNEGEEPTRIFSSVNNSDYNLDLTHPNYLNFQIEYDYSLTLNQISLENDPGLYFCSIVSNNLTKIHAYELSVAEGPICNGRTKLMEGDKLDLRCSVRNSGRVIPQLNWFKGEDRLESRPRVDVRNFTQILTFHVNYQDDKQRFACQMLFAPKSFDDCYFVLEVLYQARAVSITPSHKYDYKPGEEITCSAHGNPTPKINFGKALNLSSRGFFQSFILVVPESWAGRQVVLSCYASNKIGIKTYSMSRNHTIKVFAKSQPIVKDSSNKRSARTGRMTLMSLLVILAVIVVVIIICLVVKKRNDKLTKRRASSMAKEPSHL